jgi:Xaa-Pro aminopeptidase
MRRGLMLWREQELSASDVQARQLRLERAMRSAGLDAFLVYTNHVRSAGVTYLTGFTPYWADALLLIVPGQKPLFATALSKRVGTWIRSVNPTAEIAHSPKPGRIIGERLASYGCCRIGVLELDRLPAGLAEEMTSVAAFDFLDGSHLFADVRSERDERELNLVRQADILATQALNAVDPTSGHLGEMLGRLERAAREAGAEECYVAVAPDLGRDHRLGRLAHAAPGETFAIRLSLAYNGVWTRRTKTFSRNPDLQARLNKVEDTFERLSSGFDPETPLSDQFLERSEATGITLVDWRLEAPHGTLPLVQIAGKEHDTVLRIPYGVLSATFDLDHMIMLAAGPVGLNSSKEVREVAT